MAEHSDVAGMAFLLQMIQFSADHLHILQVNFLRRREENTGF